MKIDPKFIVAIYLALILLAFDLFGVAMIGGILWHFLSQPSA